MDLPNETIPVRGDNLVDPAKPTVIPQETQPEVPISNVKNVSPPDNQAPQVQPEQSVDTSNNPLESVVSQSASIKLEPLDVPQQASPADSPNEPNALDENNSSGANQKSFGDLLSETGSSSVSSTEAIPAQPVSSSAHSVSFGDLIKDIHPEASVVQSPQNPPIPQSSSPNTPPATHNPPPVDLSPSSSNPPPIQPQQDLQTAGPTYNSQLNTNQLKAIQARKQKHDDNIAKIVELMRKKGKAENRDVRDFLRVSQTTATDYLHTLVSRGQIKRQGQGKATFYYIP